MILDPRLASMVVVESSSNKLAVAWTPVFANDILFYVEVVYTFLTSASLNETLLASS